MNNEQCWSLLLHRNLKNIPRKYSESFLINGLITPKVNQIQLFTNIVFHFGNGVSKSALPHASSELANRIKPSERVG